MVIVLCIHGLILFRGPIDLCVNSSCDVEAVSKLLEEKVYIIVTDNLNND